MGCMTRSSYSKNSKTVGNIPYFTKTNTYKSCSGNNSLLPPTTHVNSDVLLHTTAKINKIDKQQQASKQR